jgi:hypothetical protein
MTVACALAFQHPTPRGNDAGGAAGDIQPGRVRRGLLPRPLGHARRLYRRFLGFWGIDNPPSSD